MLERAVTWIIILIVIVFDPLAVIMLLAAQMTFGWLKNPALIVEQEPIQENQIKEWFAHAKKRARFWDKNKDPAEPVDSGEQEDLPVFDTQPVEFYPLDVEGEPEEELSEDTPKELDLVEEYPFRGQGLQPGMPLTASYVQPTVNDDDHAFEDEVLADLVRDDPVDLGDFVPAAPEPVAPAPVPFSGKIYKFATNPETGEPDYSTPLEVKDITEEEFKAFNAAMIPETVVEPEQPVAEVPPEAAPGRNRGVMNTHLLAEADNTASLGKAVNNGFGNEFPSNPERGDLYLRTDYLPNRLYKFNDKQWIEVDKNATDVYAYDEMYIRHLIDQIDSGNFDVESLSDVEREQISQYLERNA